MHFTNFLRVPYNQHPFGGTDIKPERKTQPFGVFWLEVGGGRACCRKGSDGEKHLALQCHGIIQKVRQRSNKRMHGLEKFAILLAISCICSQDKTQHSSL